MESLGLRHPSHSAGAWIACRIAGLRFVSLLDAIAPGLLVAQAIGRLGNYFNHELFGTPTDLPWGMVYSAGAYPPSAAFRDFPEIVSRYGVNGIVPDTIPVHPTPLYEFATGVLIFLLLWKLRKRDVPDGTQFMLYLILSGIARFAVEFLRVNPRLLAGLSEAQLIAAVMVAIGFIGLRRVRPAQEKAA